MIIDNLIFQLFSNIKENPEQKTRKLTNSERRTVMAVLQSFQTEKKEGTSIIIDKQKFFSAMEKCQKFDSLGSQTNFFERIINDFLDYFLSRIRPDQISNEVGKILKAKNKLKIIKFELNQKEAEKTAALEMIDFKNDKIYPLYQMINSYFNKNLKIFWLITTKSETLQFLNEGIQDLTRNIEREKNDFTIEDNSKKQMYIKVLESEILFPLIELKKLLEKDKDDQFIKEVEQIKIKNEKKVESGQTLDNDYIQSLNEKIEGLMKARNELEKKPLSQL